jgi:hypothetical protein
MAASGANAGKHFLEFFAARIRNKTRGNLREREGEEERRVARRSWADFDRVFARR